MSHYKDILISNVVITQRQNSETYRRRSLWKSDEIQKGYNLLDWKYGILKVGLSHSSGKIRKFVIFHISFCHT